jgi:hypothetical protein
MARLVFFTRTTWARIVTANFAIARLSSDSGCGFAVIGLVAQLLHLRQTLSFFAALLFHRFHLFRHANLNFAQGAAKHRAGGA